MLPQGTIMGSLKILLVLPFLHLVTGEASGGGAKNKLFFVDGGTQTVTLVSLDNAAENCRLEDYPIKEPATINYMDSLAAVVGCGAYDPADATKCFAFDGSSWTSLPDSTESHCKDGSNLFVELGWWVMGRLSSNETNSRCSVDEWTSEIYTGEEWISGPEHPTGEGYSTCMVNINSTHSFHIGGNQTFLDSWLYDWTAEQWTELDKINEDRNHPSCVGLDGQGVLVAGGDVYSVELYDLETGIWTPQPDLPHDVNPIAPALLIWDSSVIAMFYGSEHVYQRAEDGTWSALEGVVLPEKFNGYYNDPVVMVADDFVNGCL